MVRPWVASASSFPSMVPSPADAGMRVSFQSYPCAHRMTSHMLSDVDTWIINQCTGRS